MKKKFDSKLAFSRNIGWLSPLEQLVISEKSVAIAGMGGVGGFHLLTLIRLGVTKFKISDFDSFEVENFNRQVGASCSTVGKPKAQVLKDMALDINPEADISVFGKITNENVADFLEGVDLYVDGLDFFAVDARELVFSLCHKNEIPAITAAPIGMGSNYLIFKDKMSFMDYFNWHNQTRQQRLINFVVGLSPKPLHLNYLVDPERVDFHAEKGPSTIMACQLCSGIVATEALKLLLGRGKVYQAPYVNQFDAYQGKLKRSHIYLGVKNPIQKIKAAVVKRLLYKMANTPREVLRDNYTPLNVIHQILDEARWAPSGDNLQPWRFIIKSENEFIIKLHRELEKDFYDFDGKPSLTSLGCLIESIRLAANQLGYGSNWKIQPGNDAIEVKLEKVKNNIDPDNLVRYLKLRSVNRNHFTRTEIPVDKIEKLNTLLDDGFSCDIEASKQTMKHIIQLNQLATQVRLQLEECHKVHCHMLQWKDENSQFGIPYTATGLNKFSANLFKLFHQRWFLIHFFNKYLGGAYLSSVELDYLPGKNSAGFLILGGEKPLSQVTGEELIKQGQQIQRLWLYLTKNNIMLQPCYTPLMLHYYQINEVEISTENSILKKLSTFSDLYRSCGFDDKMFFLARIGYPKAPDLAVRSTRLPLSQLIID